MSHAPKSTWRQRIVPDGAGNAIIVSTHGHGTTIVVEITESDGHVAGVRLLHSDAVSHAVHVSNACDRAAPEEAARGVDGETLRVWSACAGRVCFGIGDAFLVLSAERAKTHVGHVLAAASAYEGGDDER